MEALECIKTRRSVRKFTEQPVTEAELAQVVETAAFAPSWKNTPDCALFGRNRCGEKAASGG